jgi:tripartite-type tricarboxylate transporter receptor subunit TctC
VTNTIVLMVHPSVPARSVKELVALAKSRPGQLNFGSFGIGNVTHLAAELLRVESGIRMEHVPSKGETAALTGIISGEVALLFAVSSPRLPTSTPGGRDCSPPAGRSARRRGRTRPR